jgi:hypothetical protein
MNLQLFKICLISIYGWKRDKHDGKGIFFIDKIVEGTGESIINVELYILENKKVKRSIIWLLEHELEFWTYWSKEIK